MIGRPLSERSPERATLSLGFLKHTSSIPFRATEYFPPFRRRKFSRANTNQLPQSALAFKPRAVFEPPPDRRGDPTAETAPLPGNQAADAVKRVIDLVVACSLIVFVLP